MEDKLQKKVNSPNKRTSIYLSEEISKVRDNSKDNFSGRLSTIINRYNTIVEISYPDDVFNYQELSLLTDVLQDIYISDAKLIQNQTISFSVTSKIKTDSIDQKWEVDSEKLLKKIETLSYIQLISLIEHAEQFTIK